MCFSFSEILSHSVPWSQHRNLKVILDSPLLHIQDLQILYFHNFSLLSFLSIVKANACLVRAPLRFVYIILQPLYYKSSKSNLTFILCHLKGMLDIAAKVTFLKIETWLCHSSAPKSSLPPQAEHTKSFIICLLPMSLAVSPTVFQHGPLFQPQSIVSSSQKCFTLCYTSTLLQPWYQAQLPSLKPINFVYKMKQILKRMLFIQKDFSEPESNFDISHL